MLDDLDDVAWERLDHAYGEATDVPGILRAVAAGDDEALSELYGNIWHQGTVYEATAYAVPFLVEMLGLPGTDTAGLLGLLSAIADGNSYADVHEDPPADGDAELRGRLDRELEWVRAARAAVGAGAPVYLRWLADGTEDERTWAANALGVSVDAADPAVPVLLERLRTDDSALVRASLIFAAGAVGVADERRILTWLDDPAPAPRLAAALVAARTPGDLHENVTAVVERDAPASIGALERLPWSMLGADSLAWVIEGLGERWDLQVRLLTTWMRHDDAAVRKAAVFGAEIPLHAWRPAAARLVPALARRLDDPERDVRRWAASHLADAGRAAKDAADDLWALVEREPVEQGGPAAPALKALCRLKDPRAAGCLARRLAEQNLDGLQPAIELIGPWAACCRDALLALVPAAPAGNLRIVVIAALGRLCANTTRADDVVRAVRRQCRSHPHITTRVLGDLGPAAAKALPDMRRALKHEEPIVRINAARALWRISGATDRTLPVLRTEISENRYGRIHALEALAEMGTEGSELAPLLPALMAAEDDWVSMRAASAHWYLTGDATTAVPILIRHLKAGRRGTEAARVLRDIGPPARAAVPALRKGRDADLRQITHGAAGSWVTDDESWSTACAEALDRIG